MHNQRIEGWWSYLAKARGHWRIDFFRDVCASGIYNPAHHFQKCCIQYCMLPILKKDLQEAASWWNLHRIRPSRSTTCPPGIPNELFFLPANFGAVDHGLGVDRTATLPGLRDACKRPRYCEDLVIEEYLDHITSLTAQVRPRTADDGIRLVWPFSVPPGQPIVPRLFMSQVNCIFLSYSQWHCPSENCCGVLASLFHMFWAGKRISF